jgi:hypothetical protein
MENVVALPLHLYANVVALPLSPQRKFLRLQGEDTKFCMKMYFNFSN